MLLKVEGIQEGQISNIRRFVLGVVGCYNIAASPFAWKVGSKERRYLHLGGRRNVRPQEAMLLKVEGITKWANLEKGPCLLAMDYHDRPAKAKNERV